MSNTANPNHRADIELDIITEQIAPSSSSSSDVALDRMMTPDDVLEREYGITEISHTPSFGDENSISKLNKFASVFSGNMSIICSTLGTGILSLPYAMNELGLATGAALIVVFALVCVWTMWMLEEVGTALCKEEQVKSNALAADFNISFTWVSSKVLPQSGVFLEFVLFMISAGVSIAFVVAFCDCLTSVMKFAIDGSPDSAGVAVEGSLAGSASIAENVSEAFYKRMLKSRVFWAAVMYVIDVPLSYAKSLSAFRHFSFFILPCVAYLIFVLIYYTIKEGASPVNYFPSSINGIKAVPIVMFIYSGPSRRKKRTMEVVNMSTSIVFVVYIIVSVFGYLYCGKSVAGNLFNSMPNDSIVVAIARVAISINVLIGLPFLVAPGREGINALISHIGKYAELPPTVKHVIGTTLILAIGVVGWFVTSISTVLGFCGAVGSSSVSFIFPGLYYYFAFRNEPTRKKSKNLSLVCVFVGFVLMVLGLVLQIISVI